MPDFKRMKRVEIEKINLLEGATEGFVKALGRTLSRVNARAQRLYLALDTEGGRLVSNQVNLNRVVRSRAQLEEMLLEAGYRTNVRSLLNAYDRSAALSLEGLQAAGITSAFTQTDVRVLTALKDLDLSRWNRFGAEIADTVYSTALDSVVSGSSYDAMVSAFEDTLIGIGTAPSRIESRAHTLANTLSQSFDRAVTNRRAAEAGIETFVYLGPDDSLTRPFCQALLDGTGDKEFRIPEKKGDPPIYTIEEIERMDNKQNMLPVMQYAGGFNCRHKFRPVSVELAKEALA